MFTFDRDTATIVAVLMCIVATMYMYRELNKTKSEMDNVKGILRKPHDTFIQTTTTSEICTSCRNRKRGSFRNPS